MRTLVLAVALLIATAAPAAAADRTTYLLQVLDSCDRMTVWQTGPRLDVLLALADGRSASELAALLNGPRECIGHVAAYGEGADEVVLIGSHGEIGGKGAMLWVDHGYWRIAAVPLGYTVGTDGPVARDDGREYLMTFWGGGSAGAIGLVAVVVDGARARTSLTFLPGGEIASARFLADGRLYVDGRLTRDRLLTWSSHVDWPGGAQWVLERRGGTWTVVAQRQVIDPNYLITGLIGGLRLGNAASMSRFASPEVVSQALALPAPGPGYIEMHGTYDDVLADAQLTREELASWDALPEPLPAPGPRAYYRTITFPGNRNVPGRQVEIRCDRDASGWRIAWVRLVPIATSRDNELVP